MAPLGIVAGVPEKNDVVPTETAEECGREIWGQN